MLLFTYLYFSFKGKICKVIINACRSNIFVALFTGENCQKIVSACRSNPCMNGATCHNADNTYICNCTEKSAGRNCEELITPHMISNSAGITQEELFIIIG